MHTCLDLEVQAAASNAADEAVVEALDDLDKVQGNPTGSQNALQTTSVDVVKGFLKVNKTDIQLPLPFSAMFNDVALCVQFLRVGKLKQTISKGPAVR